MGRIPTRREERAHAWSHGAGVVFGLCALAGLLVLCADRSWLAMAAVATYGTCLTALFLASTVYHQARCPRRKARLQKVDHCAIYLLIAGTYTPLTLLVLEGALGWGMFATVWGLAAFGLGQELWFRPRRERLSISLYLGMGWLVAIVWAYYKPSASQQASAALEDRVRSLEQELNSLKAGGGES